MLNKIQFCEVLLELLNVLLDWQGYKYFLRNLRTKYDQTDIPTIEGQYINIARCLVVLPHLGVRLIKSKTGVQRP